MVKRFLFLACTAGCLLLCRTVAAAPSLTHSLPAALEPGKTIEISFHGKDLGHEKTPLSLQTSFPAKVEFVSEGKPAATEKNKNPQRNRVTYRITIAPGTSVGLGAVWLACTEGISDPLLLMIDDVSNTREEEKHQTVQTAQELTLPTAVDGTSSGIKSDYYKFKARAGQRVSVEVVAQRLGSQFDAVMRLLDSSGRELIFVDDDSSLGSDARLSVTVEADGEYVLQLYDVLYREGLRYRLRVGDFPLINVPFPLGGKLGTATQLEFVGPEAIGLQRLSLQVPEQVQAGYLAVSAKYPGGRSSAMATLVASTLDEQVETEPNDDPEKATKVHLPSALNGRLQQNKDRDFYEFTAKKGRTLTLKAIGRSLGSPSNLFMRLYDADGKKLMETSSGSPEETLSHKIPADGIYRLMVEDLVRRGGPEHAYRIEVTTGGTFSLALKSDKTGSDKFLAAKNGAIAVSVQCKRTGYQGPVTLSVECSGESCQVHQNIIPEKGKEIRMLIDLPEDLVEGDSWLLRIVGRASPGENQLATLAGTSALLRKRWPQIPYPNRTLDGQIGVGIVPDVKPFFSIHRDEKTVYLSSQTQLSIHLKRLEKDFKQPIMLVLKGLPAGVTSEIKSPTKEKPDHYLVDLKAARDSPAKSAKISIIGYGEFKGRVRKEILAEIPLEVVKPLLLALKIGRLTLAAEQVKLSVEIHITRFTPPGEKPAAVKLAWKNLPQGVKVSGPQEIAIGQSDAAVEFSFDGKVPIGKLAEITLQASTQFQGKESVVQKNFITLPK